MTSQNTYQAALDAITAEQMAADAYASGAAEIAKLEDVLTQELCLHFDALDYSQAETLAQRYLESAWQRLEATWCIKMTPVQVEAYVATARKLARELTADIKAAVARIAATMC